MYMPDGLNNYLVSPNKLLKYIKRASGKEAKAKIDTLG
jgi:hypothetical protein